MRDRINVAPIDALYDAAVPLTGDARDYQPSLDLIGNARFALIGEASHGTHEFYRERAELTKRLIEEKGYTAVAVEADWPDAYRVHRYVLNLSNDRNAREALSDFKRFPQWMWRNSDVVEFVEWLRRYNDSLRPGTRKVGFFGLDLYSLYTSIAVVIDYLDEVDPEAARRARDRYACFDHFDGDSQAYGLATSLGVTESCEEEAIRQLLELQEAQFTYVPESGGSADKDYFHAAQNARLVMNAEEYYRSMFNSRISVWNLRDEHMVETLDAIVAHLSRFGEPAKVAVWAHNSHLGDARATQMGDMGELNVGQLTRERHGRDAVLIGLTTYTGTVTAASDWGAPSERKRVRPALPGSYEELFHSTELSRFMLALRDHKRDLALLEGPRLERAIGVIYRPETERQSHYFYARLLDQFDAVLHFDVTQALEPLERSAQWERGEDPESFFPVS